VKLTSETYTTIFPYIRTHVYKFIPTEGASDLGISRTIPQLLWAFSIKWPQNIGSLRNLMEVNFSMHERRNSDLTKMYGKMYVENLRNLLDYL